MAVLSKTAIFGRYGERLFKKEGMKMKKLLALTLATLMLASACLGFTACGCNHDFADATCTTPKTCRLCGETEGEAAGHTFRAATCTSAKTCTVCNATEGAALGHTSEDVAAVASTCTTVGHTAGTRCSVCHETLSGMTETPVKHSTRIGYCTSCGGYVDELMSQLLTLLSYNGTLVDVATRANNKMDTALDYSTVSYRVSGIQQAFRELQTASETAVDMYVIADEYSEFAGIKDDLDTIYRCAQYLLGQSVTSSNYLTVSYEYIAVMELYLEAGENILEILSTFIED